MAIEIMAAKQPKKKRSHVFDFLAIFIILCLIGGGVAVFVMGFDDYSQMRNMQLTWTEIVEIADTKDPEAPSSYVEVKPENIRNGLVLAGLAPKPADETDYLYRPINLKALREVNADVSGYIYSPNTAINYPIMKESMPGEYYYLTHNINREEDRYGSIFELCDAERGLPRMKNAVDVVFGHNMASGAMFAGLVNYKYVGFDTNPVYIYRDNYRIEYRAFATCIIDAHDRIYDFDAYELGSDEYGELLKWIKERNTVGFTTEAPDKNEPIVVLSTCNDAHSDVRVIVCLREVRRALVPEYYETLQEVQEYGGDENAIEKEPENDDVDYRQPDTTGDNGGQVIRPNNLSNNSGHSGVVIGGR